MPIASPAKIICLGLNYVDHVKEGGYDVPTYPTLFVRFPTSMLAAGEPIVLASRVAEGRVMGSRQGNEAGLVYAGDLPPHKARVLVMLALQTPATAARLQYLIDTH